jgi:hypothetical protein
LQRRSPSLLGQRSFSSAFSPASSTRRESVLSSESRTTSNGSPYLAHSHQLLIGEPIIISPVSEPSNSRDFRPTLPHLPFNDRAGPDRPVSHGSRGRDLQYSLESRPDASAHPSNYRHHDPYSQASNSSPSSFAYGYQQPRQTYSHHLSHSQGQTPFTHAQYAGYPNQYPDMNDLSGDSRQRRRRGNLPKHTTDILNAWFLGHLQHAYPTEEEKQMLMQQTGLQMSMFHIFLSSLYMVLHYKRLTYTLHRSNLQLVHQRTTEKTAGFAKQRTSRRDGTLTRKWLQSFWNG